MKKFSSVYLNEEIIYVTKIIDGNFMYKWLSPDIDTQIADYVLQTLYACDKYLLQISIISNS